MNDIVYIFPGQGAQYLGMGREFYDASSAAKKIFDQANEVLGFDIKKICFEGPEAELKSTLNCQPAILIASIVALLETQNFASLPKFVIGLSLGEYTALYAAGVFSFEDILRLVRRRAELMEEASQKNPGKMAAILDLELEAVQEICSLTGAEIANLNCPKQVVISGKIEAVENTVELAKEKGARAVFLEVSGAFHSSLMKQAAEEFRGFLAKIPASQPKIPIIANVNALPQSNIDEIKENLVKQIYSCVYFEKSIQYISSHGINTFLEIGPGKVLKGLLRRINPSLKVFNIEKPSDISNLSL